MEVLKMENSVLFFDDACRETYRLLKEEGLIKKKKKNILLLKKFVKQSKIVGIIQSFIFSVALPQLTLQLTSIPLEIIVIYLLLLMVTICIKILFV